MISTYARNEKNIEYKTNKALGSVKQIMSALNERPYGKYKFPAAKLMRSGMLIGSLLHNPEMWINLKQKELDKVIKPDKVYMNNYWEREVKLSNTWN